MNLCLFYDIFVDAQVASFDDPRCDGGAVCPNDPLLFTCSVTDSTAVSARATLPSEVGVDVNSANMTTDLGASLPDGVTIQSYSGMAGGMAGMNNYRITLAIARASLLGGNNVTCTATTAPTTPPDLESCPLATGTTVMTRAHLYIISVDPDAPEGLSRNQSANTENSAEVGWMSPASAGGGGITISEYRVTVTGPNVTPENITVNDVTANILVPQYNTTYTVSVTAINSCGLSSQPATTDVFIEARG